MSESSKTAPQNATLDVLQRAFEDAGVIFIDENGEAGIIGRRDGDEELLNGPLTISLAYRVVEKAHPSFHNLLTGTGQDL